jgi:serine/threonine protein kinase
MRGRVRDGLAARGAGHAVCAEGGADPRYAAAPGLARAGAGVRGGAHPRAAPGQRPLARARGGRAGVGHLAGSPRGARPVHRDLKPADILLACGETGFVPKVGDFGLALWTDAIATGLTQAGRLLDTPGYMAPEQYEDAHHANVRSDIFALGCILYEMLAGDPLLFGAHATSSGSQSEAIGTRWPAAGTSMWTWYGGPRASSAHRSCSTRRLRPATDTSRWRVRGSRRRLRVSCEGPLTVCSRFSTRSRAPASRQRAQANGGLARPRSRVSRPTTVPAGAAGGPFGERR